jgi:ketosteroid isomerase-like protein
MPMHPRSPVTVRILLVSIAVLLIAGCAHVAAPWAKRVEGDIERQRQQWNQLVAYRKPADLAALVTDDVQLITPAGIVSGKKSLARSYAGLLQQRPDLVQIFTPERVERNPKWKFAAERGHWSESWQEQGEDTEVRGSYYALWKLKDGRWRLYSQIVTPLSCTGARYCKSLE